MIGEFPTAGDTMTTRFSFPEQIEGQRDAIEVDESDTDEDDEDEDNDGPAAGGSVRLCRIQVIILMHAFRQRLVSTRLFDDTSSIWKSYRYALFPFPSFHAVLYCRKPSKSFKTMTSA